jgi:hypothetical protein
MRRAVAFMCYPTFSALWVQARVSECGDSSPLSLAATRCGEKPTADESAEEKAGASSRTPKFRSPGAMGEFAKLDSPGFTPPSRLEINGDMAG